MKPFSIKLADAIDRFHLPVWRFYMASVFLTIAFTPYVFAGLMFVVAYWYAARDCPLNTIEDALRRSQDPSYVRQKHGKIRIIFGTLGPERWLYALTPVACGTYLIVAG